MTRFTPLLALTVAGLMPGGLFAQEVTIATGKEGGGYAAYADTMAKRLEQRGAAPTVQHYNGSDEISLAMCQGKAGLGIMQIDAMWARQNEGCRLQPVGIYGTEYAFLLVPPDSDIDELGDIGSGTRLLVDTVGSGSELWWRTAKAIEEQHGRDDDWTEASVVYEPAAQAATLGSFGDVHAALLVRKPDSRDVLNLLETGWELAELWDRDINDLEFNDKSLYEPTELRIEYSGDRVSEWVYEVRSYVVSTGDPAVLDLARMAVN